MEHRLTCVMKYCVPCLRSTRRKGSAQNFFYVAGSHEFEVESDLDMARPWVTLGDQAEYK